MLIFFFGTNDLFEIYSKLSSYNIFYLIFVVLVFIYYFIRVRHYLNLLHDLMSFKRRLWYFLFVFLLVAVSFKTFLQLVLIFWFSLKFSDYLDKSDAGYYINKNIKYTLRSDKLFDRKWDFLFRYFRFPEKKFSPLREQTFEKMRVHYKQNYKEVKKKD